MSKKKEQRIQELVEAYKLVGLDENFARAIAEGGNAKHIVATWKADWRGEHSAEHPAIKAVLVGNATPPEARSLLEAAEDHRDLVDAVAAGSRSMKWAHTVLSCGFKGRKEAVTALLGGLTQPLSPMYLILSYHLRMQKSLEGKITVKKPKPYLK